MLQTYVRPDDVWDYFQKNKKRLEDAVDVIAEITIDGIEETLQICLTEEKGYPLLTIEFDDEQFEKECAISENDCMQVARKLFKMLDGYEQKISEPPQEEDNADNSPIADASDVEIVDEREMELALALQEFLINALGYAADEVDCDDIGIDYDELMSILDKFEEVLYESGYYMYRPKIVEDAEGNKRLVEFPFDDELPFEEE